MVTREEHQLCLSFGRQADLCVVNASCVLLDNQPFLVVSHLELEMMAVTSQAALRILRIICMVVNRFDRGLVTYQCIVCDQFNPPQYLMIPEETET